MRHLATNNRTKRRVSSGNGGIGRMLIVSFVLHVLIFVILGGYLVPRFPQVKKPVYYVDLLHKPAAKPQAGRTDAQRTKKVKKKKIKKVVKKKRSSPKVVAHKKKITTVKKVKPKVVKKITTKPAVTKIATPAFKKHLLQPNLSSNPLDAIAEMRRKQRIAELKKQLNDLAHDPIPTTTAPVGVIGGRGNQAGVDFTNWIRTYLSKAWVLPSTYYNRGLVGKMLLRYNSSGRLIYTELLSSSGDSFFDASIKRAVQQLQQLPSKPGKQLELSIVFDPKELLAR